MCRPADGRLHSGDVVSRRPCTSSANRLSDMMLRLLNPRGRPYAVGVCLLAACSRGTPPGGNPVVPNTLAPGRLPTGARLDPTGRSADVGNFPLAAVLSPDGSRLVLLLDGWRQQGVQVLDRASAGQRRHPSRGRLGPQGHLQPLHARRRGALRRVHQAGSHRLGSGGPLLQAALRRAPRQRVPERPPGADRGQLHVRAGGPARAHRDADRIGNQHRVR